MIFGANSNLAQSFQAQLLVQMGIYVLTNSLNLLLSALVSSCHWVICLNSGGVNIVWLCSMVYMTKIAHLLASRY